ncbi:hypothetical protein B0H11DRAFT_2207470 [Mycena galericulata]|nr:hypothetical protein B0H11DRAFT_2207470 [Mycena galericulata]
MISSSDVAIMASMLDVPPLLHLRWLILTTDFADVDSVSQMQLLERLTLPALETLRISERSFPIDPVVTICNLLARSGCSVKTLHILIDEAAFSLAYYRDGLPSVGSIDVVPPHHPYDEPDGRTRKM